MSLNIKKNLDKGNYLLHKQFTHLKEIQEEPKFIDFLNWLRLAKDIFSLTEFRIESQSPDSFYILYQYLPTSLH